MKRRTTLTTRWMHWTPDGAILTREELEGVLILSMSVFLWDIDNGHIREKTILRLEKDHLGTFIRFTQGGVLLQWCNIPDDQYSGMYIDQHGYYLFNTKEQAEAAKAKLHKSYKGLLP